MSDITKCSGLDCPYKESCYRYTAKSGDLQSYFLEVPLKDSKCDYYWGKNGEDIWSEIGNLTKINKDKNN